MLERSEEIRAKNADGILKGEEVDLSSHRLTSLDVVEAYALRGGNS